MIIELTSFSHHILQFVFLGPLDPTAQSFFFLPFEIKRK
jgi:hypothetical protein